MVNTDTQDLGVQSREQSLFSFVGRDLTGSYGCPGQGKENQRHIFAAQVAQPDLVSQVAGEGEIWSLIAYF